MKTRVGVYGIVIKDQKIALLRQQTGEFENLLHLPGGGMEYGESCEETLAREIHEEMGMSFTTMSLLHNFTWTGHVHAVSLVYELKGATPIAGAQGEGHTWHEFDIVDSKLLSPIAHTALSYYLSQSTT